MVKSEDPPRGAAHPREDARARVDRREIDPVRSAPGATSDARAHGGIVRCGTRKRVAAGTPRRSPAVHFEQLRSGYGRQAAAGGGISQLQASDGSAGRFAWRGIVQAAPSSPRPKNTDLDIGAVVDE